MNEVCKKYFRQVDRAMRCPRAERRRLLSGFEPELEEAFPGGTTPAMDDLTARFGQPKALAAELMNALPEGSATRYEKGCRRRWMAFTAACLVVIALLVGFLFWLRSIDVDVSKTETKITHGPEYIVEE